MTPLLAIPPITTFDRHLVLPEPQPPIPGSGGGGGSGNGGSGGVTGGCGMFTGGVSTGGGLGTGMIFATSLAASTAPLTAAGVLSGACGVAPAS